MKKEMPVVIVDACVNASGIFVAVADELKRSDRGWRKERIGSMKMSRGHSRKPESCRTSFQQWVDALYVADPDRKIYLDGHLLYHPFHPERRR